MVDLSVTLPGMELGNPVVPASGTFGYGKEFAAYYDINILGSLSCKGTTLHPRFGNETPRIAETPAGMLNAVGLQNPGIEHVLAHELPELKRIYNKKIIANIGGFSVDEYVECARLAASADNVGMIELNISCPNVHGGGMGFGTTAESAGAVTKAVRAAVDKPLFVKLTPNVTDIAEIARAVEAAGADGISLINTLLGMRIDLRTKKPLLHNVTGGLSGPAVFPVALRMVYQVYEAVDIPLIGMGGVSSAEDVLEMMLAGATAVQVGAANLVNPTACRDIINDLPAAAARLGVTALRDIIGAAHGGKQKGSERK